MRIAIKRHILLVLFRLLLTGGVVCAFPFGAYNSVYYSTGRVLDTPYENKEVMLGVLAAPIFFGVVFAAAFFGLGSVSQFLFRKRSVRFTVYGDLTLFLVFAYLPFIGGVRME